MNLPEDDGDWINVSVDHDASFLMPDDHMEELSNGIAAKVMDRSSIREVANELQTALKGTGKFVFPGAGTFLYKNPVYNNELDLLVETNYNGYVVSFRLVNKSLQCTTELADRDICRVEDFLGRKKRGRFAPRP